MIDVEKLQAWIANTKQGNQQTDRMIAIATLEVLLEIYTLILQQQEADNGKPKKDK